MTKWLHLIRRITPLMNDKYKRTKHFLNKLLPNKKKNRCSQSYEYFANKLNTFRSFKSCNVSSLEYCRFKKPISTISSNLNQKNGKTIWRRQPFSYYFSTLCYNVSKIYSSLISNTSVKRNVIILLLFFSFFVKT